MLNTKKMHYIVGMHKTLNKDKTGCTQKEKLRLSNYFISILNL